MDNKTLNPVLYISVYLLLFTITVALNFPAPIIYLLFSLSPLLVIWMVYSVITKGTPTHKTFDTDWYDLK